MTAAGKKQGDVTAEPAFEESLAELQQIVADLEEGALGLEESMRRFERGVALLRRCFQTLEEAEQKIEVLTGISANGEAQTAPFDASATIAQNDHTNRGRQHTGADDAAPGNPDSGSDPNENSETTLF